MSKLSLIKRRSFLIKELSDMSRNGWKNARFEDYAPLETELHAVNKQLGIE